VFISSCKLDILCFSRYVCGLLELSEPAGKGADGTSSAIAMVSAEAGSTRTLGVRSTAGSPEGGEGNGEVGSSDV
jgi:hypothetical protein